MTPRAAAFGLVLAALALAPLAGAEDRAALRRAQFAALDAEPGETARASAIVRADGSTQIPIQLVNSGPETPGGVRLTLSGTGGFSTAFVTSTPDGRATLKAYDVGHHFVVAQHRDYHLGIGGSLAALTSTGANHLLERGRLKMLGSGPQASPDFLFPFTGVQGPDGVTLRSPSTGGAAFELERKGAYLARFLFIAEDSPELVRTLNPQNPMMGGKVFVTGDWSDFSTDPEMTDAGLLEMYDDGSQMMEPGDAQLGDGIYSRQIKLKPGVHAYAFLVNGHLPYVRDPYEEGHTTVTVKTPDGPRQVEVSTKLVMGLHGDPDKR